jgi:hypothetical protein
MGKRKPRARRNEARNLEVENLESRLLLAYSPAQITHAYGIDQVKFGTVTGDGSGQTIAIVDAFDDPTIESDLKTFDARYGLPDPSFQKLTPQGKPAFSSGWAFEIALDVEWAHAIAPKASIILVEALDNSGTSLYAADVFAAKQTGVSVVSNSWGGNEYNGETFDDANFVHSGVTFIFSSGDRGAPPEYASASPNVLSVGGTTLTLDSSGNWLSETGWSGSGGGPSAYEAKPAFQNGTVSGTQRGTPDVAFDANPSTGVAVYDSNNGGWRQVGGTSLGAPAWAGIIAIVNQGRVANGLSAYNGGDLLTQIYKVSANDFHDITSGNNGYAAGPGYDYVTGRGSPKANLLIPDLVGTSQPVVVPSAPTGVAATAGDGQVSLSWNASSGATSYNIYRSLTAGGEGRTAYKTGVTTTSFTDTGLTNGTKYYYTVTAVNSAGESAQSSEVSATPQQAIPSVPTGLKATAGDGQVALSWNAASGATSYNIYRSLTAGGEGRTAYKTGVTTTSFTDTGLTNGTTYYYTVTAVNSAGESAQSSEVSARPQKASTSVAIDAGGDAAGRYVADTDFSGGDTFVTDQSIDTSNVTNPAPQAVYQSQRYGDFTYTVPNLTAGASYTVRLHFAELYWPIGGIRIFNVSINGTQVLTNFDIFNDAGGQFIAILKEFTATADANGKITIDFTSVSDKAALNGLEILSSSSPAIGTHSSGGHARFFHVATPLGDFIPADSIQSGAPSGAHTATHAIGGELARFLGAGSVSSGFAGGTLGGSFEIGGATATTAGSVVGQDTGGNRHSDLIALSLQQASAAETDWTGDQLGQLQL